MSSQQPSSGSRRARDQVNADTSVGNFRILQEIGKGSFATVYKGQHKDKRTYVAVKSVHLQKLNKKLKDNLYTEIEILKGLHHPHIVALIDCKESTSHIHIVMEYCSLGDLSNFIKKREKLADYSQTQDIVKRYPNPKVGGLNEVIVRHFLKQLASALEFLRVRNYIHRDVKPQNLLLLPSPLVMSKSTPDLIPYTASDNSLVPMAGIESLPMLKIADFGFARSLPSTSLAETLCGSPLYMAPEILRYEKYDAKADLWSVGTVLYEMVVGKPPFRAANHVELLRKIERGEDRIKFGEDITISDGMKKLIRGLLKRNPVERMNFKDFFEHQVVKEDIPGLVPEDRQYDAANSTHESIRSLSRLREVKAADESDRTSKPASPSTKEIDRRESRDETYAFAAPSKTDDKLARPTETRRHSAAPGIAKDRDRRLDNQLPVRPHMISNPTAPARPDLTQQMARGEKLSPAALAMERQLSRNTASPGSSLLVQNRREHDKEREIRERAEQDVSFERDYVVVEKRAVEVNALADEISASPRMHGMHQGSAPNSYNTRRLSGVGIPQSAPATQSPLTRGTSGTKVRPDLTHQRRSSYERRYTQSPSSATSAISKALNMANFRLFGIGFSPPMAGKGQSPPSVVNAFPAYPSTDKSLVVVGGNMDSLPKDEDMKVVFATEEIATRSDVVYGFAEVKYKQLIPLAPSMTNGLGLAAVQQDEDVPEANDLTPDAIVTLSEEALVLYLKALALLATAMDIAGSWWAVKGRDNAVESASASPHKVPRSISARASEAGVRMNNVVQWIRERFNIVLEKAEFVRLKLAEAQKRLPLDHPSHPSNHPNASSSVLATSGEKFTITTGVTAEKLMYDRALEMSRAAAVNELVGEDLVGCEIAYVTAIRMLEAIIENDEASVAAKRERRSSTSAAAAVAAATPGVDDEGKESVVGAEDAEVVSKFITSIRNRLSGVRKKADLLVRRRSGSGQGSQPMSRQPSGHGVAGRTPPR